MAADCLYCRFKMIGRSPMLDPVSLDARFARSIDRSMAVLLNLVNHRGNWLEDGITFERVAARIG
jgi:hypothetical protein